MKISTMIKTGTALAVLGTAAYLYNQAAPATRKKSGAPQEKPFIPSATHAMIFRE